MIIHFLSRDIFLPRLGEKTLLVQRRYCCIQPICKELMKPSWDWFGGDCHAEDSEVDASMVVTPYNLSEPPQPHVVFYPFGELWLIVKIKVTTKFPLGAKNVLCLLLRGKTYLSVQSIKTYMFCRTVKFFAPLSIGKHRCRLRSSSLGCAYAPSRSHRNTRHLEAT